ncbi:AdipoR/hemolysin-III-related [Trinorchestia longiramus]|nr:AdipoR/hemolysin-III-related [Trinorchestia longiramus]
MTESTCKVPAAKRIAWMNPIAVGRAGYEPTTVEHWANIISHGVFVAPAIWLAWLLVESAGMEVTDGWKSVRTVACGVYGAALVLLFTVSTVFHVVCYTGRGSFLRHLLHRADRAMIYLFIASSYTPWLLLKPLPLQSWTIHLRWGIWVLAVLGILYQQVFHEMFKMVDTVFYVLIGVMPSLAVVEMVSSTSQFSSRLEYSRCSIF